MPRSGSGKLNERAEHSDLPRTVVLKRLARLVAPEVWLVHQIEVDRAGSEDDKGGDLTQDVDRKVLVTLKLVLWDDHPVAGANLKTSGKFASLDDGRARCEAAGVAGEPIVDGMGFLSATMSSHHHGATFLSVDRISLI